MYDFRRVKGSEFASDYNKSNASYEQQKSYVTVSFFLMVAHTMVAHGVNDFVLLSLLLTLINIAHSSDVNVSDFDRVNAH